MLLKLYRHNFRAREYQTITNKCYNVKYMYINIVTCQIFKNFLKFLNFKMISLFTECRKMNQQIK